MKTKQMRSILLLSALLAATPVAMTQETGRRIDLNELFRLVDTQSIPLQESSTGTAAARQAIEVAKRQKLPDIHTQLSVSYLGNAYLTDRDFSDGQSLSSPHFGNSFSLEASQTVYAGGALNAGVQIAELQHRQAAVTETMTQQNERFIALGQYLDIYRIDNRREVVERNIELTRQLIEEICAKQQQGMALKNDITRYELQMEDLKLSRTKLINSRSVLNHQLCHTLGLSLDTEIQPDDRIVSEILPSDGEPSWQERAVATSPSLQMAVLAERMAEQQERLTKSEMLPKIAVVAADSFNGPITYEVPPIDKNINIWYVGIGVQYSLSALFKSNRKVSRARLLTRRSQENSRQVSQQVDDAIQAAHTDYMQQYAEWETRKKSVQLATQNYQVMRDRYMGQLVLVTDMIEASNLKLNAELSEVDARIGIVYGYYKLKYQAGEI